MSFLTLEENIEKYCLNMRKVNEHVTSQKKIFLIDFFQRLCGFFQQQTHMPLGETVSHPVKCTSVHCIFACLQVINV